MTQVQRNFTLKWWQFDIDKAWPCVVAWAQVKVELDTGTMPHRRNNCQRRRETQRLQNAEAMAREAERVARAAAESARAAEAARKEEEEKKKAAQEATKKLYEIARDAKEAEKKAVAEASSVREKMEEVKTEAGKVEQKMMQAEAALALAVTVKEALGFPFQAWKITCHWPWCFVSCLHFCLPFFGRRMSGRNERRSRQ